MVDEDGYAHNEAGVSLSAQTPFDYTVVEEPKRIRVQMKAEAIRVRMKRTAEDIIAIGQDLIEVKQALGHGVFQTWLEAEFEMSDSAATKFMQVAARFGEESKSVKITHLPVTILYALAAPSTPNEIVERVLTGEIPADARAIRDAKEAQRKAEEALSQVQKERSVVETRLLHVDYEHQRLQEALQTVKQERDRLREELEGGLEAYYEKKLQLKAENTFLGLLMHGMQQLAEIEQYLNHLVSAGMLREVRRLGEVHQERFALFLAQLQETSHTLYEVQIKLTGPLKEGSIIVDEQVRPREETAEDQ